MLWSFGQVRATMLHPGMRTSSIFDTQHVATRRNRVAKRPQHVAPNNVAIFCIEMLRSFGQSLQMLGQQCLRICCVYMLRSLFSFTFNARISRGYFFLAVFIRVTPDGLSERWTTRSLAPAEPACLILITFLQDVMCVTVLGLLCGSLQNVP